MKSLHRIILSTCALLCTHGQVAEAKPPDSDLTDYLDKVASQLALVPPSFSFFKSGNFPAYIAEVRTDVDQAMMDVTDYGPAAASLKATLPFYYNKPYTVEKWPASVILRPPAPLSLPIFPGKGDLLPDYKRHAWQKAAVKIRTFWCESMQVIGFRALLKQDSRLSAAWRLKAYLDDFRSPELSAELEHSDLVTIFSAMPILRNEEITPLASGLAEIQDQLGKLPSGFDRKRDFASSLNAAQIAEAMFTREMWEHHPEKFQNEVVHMCQITGQNLFALGSAIAKEQKEHPSTASSKRFEQFMLLLKEMSSFTPLSPSASVVGVRPFTTVPSKISEPILLALDYYEFNQSLHNTFTNDGATNEQGDKFTEKLSAFGNMAKILSQAKAKFPLENTVQTEIENFTNSLNGLQSQMLNALK